MTALRFIGLALGLTAGIVGATLSLHLPTALLAALLAVGTLLAALAILAERRWRPWHPAIAFATAAIVAFPLAYWRTASVIGPAPEASLTQHLQGIGEGTRIQLRGYVSREPEFRTDGQLDLQLRATEIRIGTETNAPWRPVSGGEALIRIISYADNAPETLAHFNRLAMPQTYGYRIELAAPFRPILPALNPADFNYASFLQQNGAAISLRCHAARVSILDESRGNPLTELALAAKADFLETFKRTIRSPASRLAAAATLGTRRAVEKTGFLGMDIAQTFRHAGVGHVLAVSGLHVSVIAVMLFALFRMTGASPRLFVPPLIFFLLLFALLTGARPSSMRAVIMNSTILVAIAYFRCDFRSATAIGLSLSALAILLVSPMVLFAPSFLLSYGAVLSLIVLGAPFDRFLRALRGFSLIGFLLWFTLLIVIASTTFHWLCNLTAIASLGGLLWLLIATGSTLNHRFPRMWAIGLERIPAVVRVFLAAQLAIQVGMMIPLSAWFFGQFPVAGVFVNLLAIPAIGILVQLGMMTGLIGMIPVVGLWLAMPLGAAATLIGNAFLLLAYAGARAFPFPPVPMPTPQWMLAYFGILLLLLVLEQQRTAILDVIYRFAHTGRDRSGWRKAVFLVPPALLTLLPLVNILFPNQPSARHVDILAAGRYPLVAITGGGKASVINAGGRFDGERLLFGSIRRRGATRIQTILLPSPHPRAGVEGITALLPKMQVDSVLLPVLPAKDETLTGAIGDRYLIEQAAAGNDWAVLYDRSFDALRVEAERHGTRLSRFEDIPPSAWGNVAMTMLPRPATLPPRFAASSITPLLKAFIHGRSWVVVTDTTSDALKTALAGEATCDVLVVPNLSAFASYSGWLRTTIETLRPRLLIVAGDAPVADAKLRSAVRNARDLIVFQTGRDGAVSADLLPDGTTLLTTHLTRQEFRFAPAR